jgi:hypothetical protein
MLFDRFATPDLPPAFKYILEDQTPVLVRPLRPDDAPRLKAGFAQLSQLARRRHNFAEQEGLEEDTINNLFCTDAKLASAWGAANMKKPDEPGIGIARYVTVNGDPTAADVAIVIGDNYQGRGAGFVLQACLHITAARNGIKTFSYDVPSDYERIVEHLKLMGAHHAGRANNIDRLAMPVYRRPSEVPKGNAIARRFAEVFKKLHSVEAVADA